MVEHAIWTRWMFIYVKSVNSPSSTLGTALVAGWGQLQSFFSRKTDSSFLCALAVG